MENNQKKPPQVSWVWLVLLFMTISGMALGQDWELVMSLKSRWKFTIGDKMEWASPDYNDGNWESIPVPAMWENEGFNGYDGYAWYRKFFSGSNLPKNKPLYLILGYIDDVDEVYVNGRLVGFSGSFPPKFNTAHRALRRYLIPEDLINFDGSNLISVRVYDKFGEGGILSGDPGIYTSKRSDLSTINLQGLWSFKRGDNSQWKNRYFNDDDWEQITVPRPWENQGHQRYDGYGWYRKTIRFTESQVKNRLVLILGKIDDFDQTYFNGQLIGTTNDHKSYGNSSSYTELRVYEIPPELIRVGQTNTIAVRVLDMGNVGGIYEGPTAIVPVGQVREFLRVFR